MCRSEPTNWGMRKKTSTWLTLKKAIEGFNLECNARGLSPHTISNYMDTLNRFCEKLGDIKINQITTSDIISFLNSYTHLKNKSLLNMHISLSAFWSWLVRQGYAEENILRKIPRPKPQIIAIQPFTELEIKAMFGSLGKNEDRNRAILLLLLDTGIRASELVNLKRDNIDLQSRTIKVLGKGNKERIIPFSTRTATAIFKVLAQTDTEYPFGLNRCRLTHLLQEIGKRAGVQKVHAHRFRHTFAVYYLRNGGDIFSLQAILGHSSMEMVKRYLALAQVDINQAHKRASPVLSLKL